MAGSLFLTADSMGRRHRRHCWPSGVVGDHFCGVERALVARIAVASDLPPPVANATHGSAVCGERRRGRCCVEAGGGRPVALCATREACRQRGPLLGLSLEVAGKCPQRVLICINGWLPMVEMSSLLPRHEDMLPPSSLIRLASVRAMCGSATRVHSDASARSVGAPLVARCSSRPPAARGR